MTPLQKSRLTKWTLIIFVPIAIILIVYPSYVLGINRGLIIGLAAGARFNNKSICSYLNMTELDDHSCLVESSANYSVRLDCKYMNFTVNGAKELDRWSKFTANVRSFPMNVYMGCKVI